MTFVTQATDLIDGFREYGPIGIVAGLMAIACGVLFKLYNDSKNAEIKRLTDELVYQKARGDRLDQELRSRSDTIQERYVVALQEAKNAVAESVIALRQVR